MDVSLQVQGTHLHQRIFILTLANSHLKVCSFNIFIQTDMNAYQASTELTCLSRLAQRCSHILRVLFRGSPLKCSIFPIILDSFWITMG
ncbi:hypothetical protein ABVT39_022456 [Epinephelus coioides]